MHLVFKTVARTPASGPDRVATLDDKSRDDSMKGEAVVKFTGREVQEIGSCHGRLGGKERCLEIPLGSMNYNPNIVQHRRFNLVATSAKPRENSVEKKLQEALCARS